MTGKVFNGFPKEFTSFFTDLAMNNNKSWFNEHRQDYEQFVLEPSKLFVIAMGERLTELSRDINAIPMVNKSLFRLNRDTRFSKDKSPYKTNLGILFWEGRRKRMECPGFYFHVEANTLMLGDGMYQFPK
ncbi:TIGR02453 family protein, partial [[Eubacterium] cellulosolvens]